MTTCAPLHGMTTVLFIVCEKDELRPFAYRVKYFLYIIISIVVSSTLAIETDGINKATSRILSMVARDRVNRLLDHVSQPSRTRCSLQCNGCRGARSAGGVGEPECREGLAVVSRVPRWSWSVRHWDWQCHTASHVGRARGTGRARGAISYKPVGL